MANPDISLVVEKPEEKAAARNRYSNSEATTVEQSFMKDEDGSSRKRSPKYEEIYDHNPQGSFLQKWKKIFVVSCLFAVLLDPLFLYVPMMKDDVKCLQLDRNLKITALLLRSFTDLFYIFDIIVQVCTSDNFSGFIDEYHRRQHSLASEYARDYLGYEDVWIKRANDEVTFWSKSLVAIAQTMWGSYVIIIDILAILPLPQVAILVFFSKMRDLRSLNTIRMVIMNLFVLLQYVPRVIRIYLSCKEFKTTLKGDIRETPIWIKGVLNFFMYILASHVFGAIWYFFAIQRVSICWHDACRKENGCSASTFGCHDHHTFRNIAFLNDLCPISPMNATLFDFGIYTKVLQSGIPGSTNYFQKFSNCFWLGLRHLSSLGSNLEPSIDGWENLFVAFISIIGLLLFLYLIGNLQTYMQLETARIEAHRHKMKVERKMEEKSRETELWLSQNGIPRRLNKDIKSQIMNKVRQELEENRDADLDYIFSILPLDLQSQFKSYMPMARLKQVPMFRNVDEIVLKATCGYLRPMNYVKNDIITREGEQLEMMLFIVDGLVTIEQRDGSPNNLQQRGGGEVCGEELLDWPLSVTFPDVLPLALESATAIDDVEALVLKASDLKNVVYKFLMQYILNKKSQMEGNGRLTEMWLSANCVPKRLHKEMKLKIMEKVRQELEENRDADFSHILSILPLDLHSQIKSCKPMARLKQVPMLRNMDERVLSKISGHIKLREFDDNSIIIEKSKPLKMMLFIVDGVVSIEKRDGSSSSNNNLQQRFRGAGEVCGEDLLRWPLSNAYPRYGVFATESAKAIGHVEALVLTDNDLFEALFVMRVEYLAGMMCRTFSGKELEKATDNYHQSRIIGKGNHVTFYKGVLPDDDKTVVEVVKYESFCQYQYVATKAATASQTNHINVVRFLGGCLEPQTLALVFEYIPNGTLLEHIHKEEAAGSFEGSSSSPTALRSLELRLKIASETAGALAYLHSLTPQITHECLSTEHILLDDHYTAKLSHIGHSRTVLWRLDYSQQGYLDPHFQSDRLAEKSDVYSFGVVLAELLTSQKPVSVEEGPLGTRFISSKEEKPLVTWFLSTMEEGRLNQILDGEITVNQATSATAKKVADLAKRCLRSKREERPSMEQVAVELAEYQRGQPSFSNRPTSLQP